MPLDAQSPVSFGTACLREIRKRQALRHCGSPPQPPLTDQDFAAIIDELLVSGIIGPTPSLPVTAKTKAGTNIPPTPEEVTAYSASIGYPLDGASFCDSYEAKGWQVGKVKMKNWQAAVRNWKQNNWGKLIAGTNVRTPIADAKDYSKF